MDDLLPIEDITYADQQLYLVCEECGEVFDSITEAFQHQLKKTPFCNEGFAVKPESEAL